MKNGSVIGKVSLLLLLFLMVSIRHVWSGQDTPAEKLEAEEKEIIENLEALEIFDLLKGMDMFEDYPMEEDMDFRDVRRN